ncbi:MAG TPA: serine hydrolase domain-containing protein [Nitrospira sp.]|nr:serine hydrolase domain-containing protein [Nitrospira sp.]
MTVPDAIQAAMDQAVQDGVFPGAVLAVRLGGVWRCLARSGRLSTDPPGEPVQPSTIYDLASLTKPLATVTTVLLLVQSGKLALDTPIENILVDLGGAPIGSARLRDLLTHSAGLPGWRPLYERLEAKGILPGRTEPGSTGKAVLRLIRDEPLIYERGTRSLYSDLGFMLLGLAVERVGGMSLDKYFEETVAGPLHAQPLLFVPAASSRAGAPSVDCSMIAPTEWVEGRGRLLRGDVHDDNAAAMGGVAGHAGLFGTAEAVLAVSGAWLQAHCGQPSILDRDLVREFTRQSQVPQSSWALGWDTPTVPSSSGRYFSAHSFGHLGYTGTSLWIDPQRELEVALLSNRVHPSRRNEKIREFRPLIHDLAYREFASGG